MGSSAAGTAAARTSPRNAPSDPRPPSASEPLLTKKKLKCQQCGKYNDVGTAKAFDEPAAAAPAPTSSIGDVRSAGSFVPTPRETIVVKGTMGRVEFDGMKVTVYRSLQGSKMIPLPKLTGITYIDTGMGATGIWFGREGFSAPTKKTITADSAALTFPPNRRQDFDRLVAAINEQRGDTATVGVVEGADAPAAVAATPPPPPPSVPAGWYPDPQGAPVQRYWDGGAWTEHTAPVAP